MVKVHIKRHWGCWGTWRSKEESKRCLPLSLAETPTKAFIEAQLYLKRIGG